MEELKIVQRLKRQIEMEYHVENAFDLAEALVYNGATEITDDIREKVNYLHLKCANASFDNYWFVDLVANYSLEEIMERYHIYEKYVDEKLCRIDSLAFTGEKEKAYISLLTEYGLNHEQIANVMKKVVENGSIAKSEADARKIIDDLNVFGIADGIRNQFISNNADLLFDDYSRKADQVFELLCQKYGKADGFIHLPEHPEYIRFGIDVMKS